MKISKAVAMRIREILNKKNISQYKLEKDSGLSKGTLTSLMYERYKSVNLTTLFIIIQTLDLTVSEFFDSPLFKKENIEIE